MTANEYLYNDLLREARTAAEARGHRLRGWCPTGRLAAITDCRDCGADLHVNAAPAANERHTSGTALLLCRQSALS